MEGWKIVGFFLLFGIYASQAQEVSSLLHSDEWQLTYLIEDEPQDTIPASGQSVVMQQTDTINVKKEEFKPNPKKKPLFFRLFFRVWDRFTIRNTGNYPFFMADLSAFRMQFRGTIGITGIISKPTKI